MGSDTASGSEHRPVMPDQLLSLLDLSQSDTVIDATFGFGGHASRVLDRLGPQGTLVGFERDPEIYEQTSRRFADEPRVTLHNESYAVLDRFVEPAAGAAVYFDLGVCSYHLDSADRGFSYRRPDEPFDLRFNPESEAPPARELLNSLERARLKEILGEHGELRFFKPVLDTLLEVRPVRTVGEVVGAVETVVPSHMVHGELARLFQAFRIAVNRELEQLKQGLRAGFESLEPGGRLVAISFHSLEDRIVKHYFKKLERACLCPPELPVCACDEEKLADVVTQSPLRPEEEEIEVNPRARSAKMRALEKL